MNSMPVKFKKLWIKLKIGKTVKTILYPFFLLFGGVIEQLYMIRPLKPAYAPVFIIGPSRSGSTLLMQVFVHSLGFSFINNFMRKNSHSPIFTAQMMRLFSRDRDFNSNFTSRLGKSKGWGAPNSASKFFKRWFEGPEKTIQRHPTDNMRRRRLVNTVSMLEYISGKPFLNKWTGNSARVPELAAIFPDAVFVRIHRSPMQVVQSVLVARRKHYGDPYHPIVKWPVDYIQSASTHYTEQICRHLQKVESELDQAEQTIGSERFFHTSYFELCHFPVQLVEKMRKYYLDTAGIELNITNRIPDSFKYSDSIKVDRDEYQMLVKQLKELNMETGDIYAG